MKIPEASYYDRNGNPLEAREWMRLFTNWDYKRILRTQVGKCDVSTVWMGLNHNLDLDGPPLIFETFVFDGPYDGCLWRYTTEEEAIKTHKQIIKAIAEGNIPPPSNVKGNEDLTLYKRNAYQIFTDNGPEVA